VGEEKQKEAKKKGWKKSRKKKRVSEKLHVLIGGLTKRWNNYFACFLLYGGLNKYVTTHLCEFQKSIQLA